MDIAGAFREWRKGHHLQVKSALSNCCNFHAALKPLGSLLEALNYIVLMPVATCHREPCSV